MRRKVEGNVSSRRECLAVRHDSVTILEASAERHGVCFIRKGSYRLGTQTAKSRCNDCNACNCDSCSDDCGNAGFDYYCCDPDGIYPPTGQPGICCCYTFHGACYQPPDAPCCAPKPKPPKPPKPPAHHWPTFATQADLQNDPWGTYIKEVYGELPSPASYPYSIGQHWLIYDLVVAQSQISNIPASIGRCPPSNPAKGTRYSKNNIYSPADVSWAWHPYPYVAFTANSWVEVMHEADPFGDELHGAWFVYAKGSGIYFDLGNTIAFSEHQAAYTYFGIHGPNWNQNLCTTASAQGFDSIQFLAHVDSVSYPCDTQSTGHKGLHYMNIEIVGTALIGTYACGGRAGAPPTIKAGYGASRACVCNNNLKYLNCQGVPTMGNPVQHDKVSTKSNILV